MSAEFFLKYSCRPAVIPEIVCCNPGNRDEALLRFFYKEIGCESIEVVRFPKIPGILGIVDEEGRLKVSRSNLVGSLLYGELLVGNLIIGQHVLRDGEPDIGGFDTVIEAQSAAAKIHSEVHADCALLGYMLKEDAR